MYDVIILGAGVAGSYLAQLLKENGVDVVILDKKSKKSGSGFKDDSGVVSIDFLDMMKNIGTNFGKRAVRSKIDSMKLVSPSGKTITVKGSEPFALLLNKQILEDNLHTGLSIRKEKTWKIDVFHDCVHVWTDKNDYKCRIVVGADGANSFVRKQMKMSATENVNGFLLRTKKRVTDSDTIEVYFNKNYSDIYAWHIPKNREFGLIINSESMKEKKTTYIENLKYDMDMSDISPEQITVTGAPIPIGFSVSYADRCLLIGDAASQTKPLTGGGIVFSLRCSKHASNTIAKAIKAGDFSEQMLSEYEDLWKKELGKTIKIQMLFRRVYKGLNNRDIDKIFDIVGDDIESVDFKDYDNPIMLLDSLSNLKKTQLLFKGVKGALKSVF